jgi:prolyl 4-hydroxylase
MTDGLGMIRQAAALGDGEAAHLCAVIAAQDHGLPNRWQVACGYLTHAATLGHALAQAQLHFLSESGSIDFARWLSPAPFRAVFEAPRIAIAEGFASAAECDWLIARARPRLSLAEIYDPAGKGGARDTNIRDNRVAQFNIAQSDVILALLRERIARATGLAVEHMEPAMVMHYETGQQFAPHFDFVDPEQPGQQADIARHGQRVATFLLYLDDGGDGGETEFVDLGWRHRGRKGDALIFHNVDAQGRPDRRTRHAGLPPRAGEKWLLSQWIRKR